MRARSLLWTVVPALPLKDHPQPAVERALDLVRADVAVLLAIGHDNVQCFCLALHGVFLPVHGPESEHSGSRCVAGERFGHQR